MENKKHKMPLLCSNCVQEYKEVVGGVTSQQTALPSWMGLAAALASGNLGRCYYGDCIPPTPNPPGWVPADGQDSPSGVQQRELLGAGSADGRGGERVNQPAPDTMTLMKLSEVEWSRQIQDENIYYDEK